MQPPSRRGVLTGVTALVLAPALHTVLTPARALVHDHPVKIVFPFAAGGTGDALARLIAQQLQGSLGVPVVVENKSGAGGRIGAQAVKVSAPDGATLLFTGVSQFAIQPHLYANLGFDPLTDFVPISQTVTFDLGIAVSGKLPVNSIAELRTWLAAHPEQASYGSPGAGSLPFFVGAEVSRLIGHKLIHVPYRGTSAALPDLLSGRLPLYIAGAGELVEHHRNGGLRVLAVSAARTELLPGVPTLRQSGVDFAATSWFGFYAPGGTPPDMLEHLEHHIVAATKAPELRARILALGYEPVGSSSTVLRALQTAEFERWGAVVRASGFKADAE